MREETSASLASREPLAAVKLVKIAVISLVFRKSTIRVSMDRTSFRVLIMSRFVIGSTTTMLGWKLETCLWVKSRTSSIPP